MADKLDEILNLGPADDNDNNEQYPTSQDESSTEMTEQTTDTALTERIEQALEVVSDLNEHDEEMDEIAKEALDSYRQFKNMGMGVTDAHAGRILEVASTMLKTAVDARDSKTKRKLKMLELQLKKARLDEDAGREENKGTVYHDRNELIKMIKESDDEVEADVEESDTVDVEENESQDIQEEQIHDNESKPEEDVKTEQESKDIDK